MSTCLRICRGLYPPIINGSNLLYTTLGQRSAFTPNPPQLLRQVAFARYKSSTVSRNLIPKPPKIAKPADPYKIFTHALNRHDITTAWTQFEFLQKVYPAGFDALDFARLLHTLKKSSLTDKIPKTLVVRQFMGERTIKIDSMHRAHLVGIYVSEGQPDTALAMLDEARQRGEAILWSEYTEILNYFVANGRITHAIEIYKQLLNSDLLQTTKDHNFLVVSLLKTGMITEAKIIANEMRKLGISVDTLTYTMFIEEYIKNGQLDEAVALFEDMAAHGVERSAFACMTIVNAYSKEKRLAEAIALFESVLADGMEPDKYLYTTMIDVYAKHGQLDAAVALFKSVSASEVKLTTVTYSAMISAYARHEQLDNAVALFNSMSADGVEQNTQTYTIMISAYTKCGRLKEALELFEAMDDRKVLKNVYTYNVMVDAYGKRGMMEEARALIELMKAKGLSLDVTMCVSMFDACTKIGKFAEAEEYLRQGRDQFGDNALFAWPGFANTLMNYHNRCGHHEDVLDVWENLIVHVKHQQQRQLETGASILLDSAGRNTDLETVILTWDKIISIEGFRPNTNNYSSFVEALCHWGAVDEAIKVVTDLMPVANVRPEYKTITSLLAPLLRTDRLDDYRKACKALEPLHWDLFSKWEWEKMNLPSESLIRKWGVTSMDY